MCVYQVVRKAVRKTDMLSHCDIVQVATAIVLYRVHWHFYRKSQIPDTTHTHTTI